MDRSKYFLAPLMEPRIADDGALGQKSDWRMYLNNYLQGRYGHTKHLSWTYTQSGPPHDTRWLAIAYCKRCWSVLSFINTDWNGFLQLMALNTEGAWPATGEPLWKALPKPPIAPWHHITPDLF